jgi:hypothetical protein
MQLRKLLIHTVIFTATSSTRCVNRDSKGNSLLYDKPLPPPSLLSHLPFERIASGQLPRLCLEGVLHDLTPEIKFIVDVKGRHECSICSEVCPSLYASE